jgi:hypothetical protein
MLNALGRATKRLFLLSFLGACCRAFRSSPNFASAILLWLRWLPSVASSLTQNMPCVSRGLPLQSLTRINQKFNTILEVAIISYYKFTVFLLMINSL